MQKEQMERCEAKQNKAKENQVGRPPVTLISWIQMNQYVLPKK